MKLNKISLGVAAVIGLLSAPAHALLASSYTNGSEFSGDTLNIRMSGATAQDPGVLAATLRFCTAGSMTAYTISNNFVYFCNIDTTKLTGVTARGGSTPSKLALYKFSTGGSANGVTPVNNASNLAFLDLTKLNTSCTAGSATADADGTATNLSTYQVFSCTAASSNLTTNALSYIGISDVEPAFFGAPSSYSKLSSAGLATVIFGVPVTKNVYNALQSAQGLTVGSLTEANMPSLSQAQITSMFTQEGQTWSGLGTGITLADDTVYVARRPNSSGTQKTFEALIARTVNGTLGARNCQSDVESFVSGVDALDNNVVNNTCDGTNLVVNGSGSGQVQACLNKHNDAGRGAVGVQTTETKVSSSSKFLFVKINGVAPTQANVASGKYTAYSDAAINLRTGATSPTASADNYSNFVTKFKSAFADAAIIGVINGAAQPFGASGLMALDNLESPVPTADYTGAEGRNPWSRLVGGTTLNNCQPGKAAAF